MKLYYDSPASLLCTRYILVIWVGQSGQICAVMEIWQSRPLPIKTFSFMKSINVLKLTILQNKKYISVSSNSKSNSINLTGILALIELSIIKFNRGFDLSSQNQRTLRNSLTAPTFLWLYVLSNSYVVLLRKFEMHKITT